MIQVYQPTVRYNHIIAGKSLPPTTRRLNYISPDHFDPSIDLLCCLRQLGTHSIYTNHTEAVERRPVQERGTNILGKNYSCHLLSTCFGAIPSQARWNPRTTILINNKSLTRGLFSATLNRALKELHMDLCQFNMHSFRIGAATSAKQANISDSHLKPLGKWRSDAHLQCVCLSSQDLAGLSKIYCNYPIHETNLGVALQTFN